METQYIDYQKQKEIWPQEGQHIMANFDDESISVYQAYRPDIASYAVTHQEFGGEFSFSRMSWIKPNFLWMMFRSGWATKEGQEHILEIRLSRIFFDELLTLAVPSGFSETQFNTMNDWKKAVINSDVRLQWDPDHNPSGGAVRRRAIQLGLRGDMLKRYSNELCWIKDITDFVSNQRNNIGNPENLLIPQEKVYRSF